MPSLTPAPNQITNGQQIWQLESVDFPAYITALGRTYSPPTRRDPLQSYVFLRMNFICTTGDSLIELYSGADLGLTFVHKQSGYPDLSIEDLQGHKYLVTLLGDCWLAAPIPHSRIRDGAFQLNFKDLPPFFFEVPTPASYSSARISLVSDQDGTEEIFAMNPDGTGLTRLTSDFGRAAEPAWSSDQYYIAYISHKTGNGEIVFIDPEGTKIATISSTPHEEGSPVWSPMDDQLAFHTDRDGNWEIYAASIFENSTKNLTSNPADDQYPSWSPDGSLIAFQSNRAGNLDIYIMASDGSEPHPLIQGTFQDILPVWSPDGEWLAFWSNRSGSWRLYRARSSGEDLEELTTYENPGPSPSRPAWSPDGESILLSLRREQYLQLFQLHLSTMEITRITNAPANYYNPDW
jgi:Tol biopolymer transport system component